MKKLLLPFFLFSVFYCAAQDQRIWGTYYGGEDWDGVRCIASDVWGNIYISGMTQSQSGFTSGGFQNVYGGGTGDAYLVKFNSSGNRLWATYYGGTELDESYDITIDPSGNVYITGRTYSTR